MKYEEENLIITEKWPFQTVKSVSRLIVNALEF